MTKPLFVEPLVQIHGLIHEVEEVKVMLVDTNYYHLHEFFDKQNQVRSSPVTGAQKEFEGKHDAVVSILDKLIGTATRAVEAEPYYKDNGGGKSKSMVQEKQEAKERARHQRIALKDAAMLGDCIRLVDYMFQAALATTVIKASMELAARLEVQHKLFIVSVGFGETTVNLDPPREQFVDTLRRLWEGTINVVNSVQSFTSVRQYESYTRIMNTQKTSTILVNNRQYIKYTTKILDAMNDQIDSTQAYATDQYESYRRIYDYGACWDEDAFIEKDYSYAELYKQMMLMREYQEDLDKFRTHHVVGIIYVDGKALRNELVPIPDSALMTMKRLLMSLARGKCSVAFQRFDAVNKALDERPKELSKFASYVKMYQMITDEQADMDDMMEEVETMHFLMKSYNVKISMEDSIQHEALQARVHDFTHKKMIEGKGHIDDVQTSMVDENYNRSLEVEEKMKGIQDELIKGSFIDPEKIPYAHEVLDELDRIQELQLSKFQEKAETFTEQEQLLGAHPMTLGTDGKFDFVELKKTQEMFQDKLKLWEIVAQWQDLSAQWHGNDFPKVDVEAMNKHVLSSFRLIGNMSRAMPTDKVVSNMKTMIQDIKTRMPGIMDLGNPAMRPRHWEKLFKKVNLPWKGPASATSINLRMLEEAGIFEHTEFISEISATASGEFALEQSIEQIIAAWADALLPIQNHRGKKDLWILGDLVDVVTLVEDHSVTVATMMGSRFIHGIREKVEVWEKQLNTAADVIDEWYQVQRAWMYL
jgi:dynein heavy chain